MKHYYGNFFPQLYPSLTWKKRVEGKQIFLTFDDGPIPEVTPWVLDCLDDFDAKATFFCVGDNVRKHKSIYENVIARGHKTGNHTFNHYNARKVSTQEYLDNVAECNSVLNSADQDGLFRPPYGRLKYKHIKELPKNYEVIMWDVLTGDFSPELAPQKCLDMAIKYSRPGSIVLMHDSLKSYKTIQYMLPKFLKHLKDEGYEFLKL